VRALWNFLVSNIQVITISTLVAIAFTFFFVEAHKQDIKNLETRDELKDLQEAYTNVLDENWSYKDALQKADGTISNLKLDKEGLEKSVQKLKKDRIEYLDGHTYLKGKSYNIQATAYTQSAEEGTADGITFTETKVAEGRTVAVDPNIIPLGSLLYIESESPLVGGFYVAEDTGSAIKGNRVDIYMESKERAFRFGEQDVEVTIMKEVN
jgi:3D (Asp-Asp-Asp) domain-containing protein